MLECIILKPQFQKHKISTSIDLWDTAVNQDIAATKAADDRPKDVGLICGRYK
jgi:hypothetical protein